MKQYLVVTKTKAYLIDADIYGIKEVQGGRRSIYEFYRKGGKLVATFNVGDVKAVIQQ